MEIIKVIIMIASFILTFAGTVAPLVIKLHKANKERKEAKTAAEKERALNEMIAVAQQLVKGAEIAFAGFDVVMKQQSSSAGAMKKKSVTTDLQAYALTHGYEYDAEYWSAKIDEIVAFTREVNAKK